MTTVRLPNDELVNKLMRKQTRFWQKLDEKRQKEREAKKLKEGKSNDDT